MAKEAVVKSVLNKKKQSDSWFLGDYTVNLYNGCSFNCLYCYIRGSKYGLNMEESLSVKANAIEILDRQLANRARKNQFGIIMLSSATDPYLNIEKKYEFTREALKIIARHKFPVHIITKSNLIERDFDLLHRIDKSAILPADLKSTLKRGVIISFSFSTLENHIAHIFEPGATTPSDRLNTVRNTKKEGFLTGISLMPLLPYISDTTEQLHHFFTTFKSINADYVMPATLTLFGNGKADSKTLVMNAVRKHFPDLMSKYQTFFTNGYQMPHYYQKAFSVRMKELSQEYRIRSTIIPHASGEAKPLKSFYPYFLFP